MDSERLHHFLHASGSMDPTTTSDPWKHMSDFHRAADAFAASTGINPRTGTGDTCAACGRDWSEAPGDWESGQLRSSAEDVQMDLDRAFHARMEEEAKAKAVRKNPFQPPV